MNTKLMDSFQVSSNYSLWTGYLQIKSSLTYKLTPFFCVCMCILFVLFWYYFLYFFSFLTFSSFSLEREKEDEVG